MSIVYQLEALPSGVPPCVMPIFLICICRYFPHICTRTDVDRISSWSAAFKSPSLRNADIPCCNVTPYPGLLQHTSVPWSFSYIPISIYAHAIDKWCVCIVFLVAIWHSVSWHHERDAVWFIFFSLSFIPFVYWWLGRKRTCCGSCRFCTRFIFCKVTILEETLKWLLFLIRAPRCAMGLGQTDKHGSPAFSSSNHVFLGIYVCGGSGPKENIGGYLTFAGWSVCLFPWE